MHTQVSPRPTAAPATADRTPSGQPAAAAGASLDATPTGAAVHLPDALGTILARSVIARSAQATPEQADTAVEGPVLQRMLVRYGTSPAETLTEKRLRQSNPVEFRVGKIAALQPGEILHLLAHGDQSGFGDFNTAEALFVHLRKEGLKPSVAGIQLLGCESAQFAERLRTAVNSAREGWEPSTPIPVRGIAGYHLVSTSGRSFSVGETQGDAAFWGRETSEMVGRLPLTVGQLINRNPTDELIAKVAKEYNGTVLAVERLATTGEALAVMTRLAARQLTAQAKDLLGRGEDPFAADELTSLNQMMRSFLQFTSGSIPDTSKLDPAGACRKLLAAMPAPNAGRPLPTAPAMTTLPPPPESMGLPPLPPAGGRTWPNTGRPLPPTPARTTAPADTASALPPLLVPLPTPPPATRTTPNTGRPLPPTPTPRTAHEVEVVLQHMLATPTRV